VRAGSVCTRSPMAESLTIKIRMEWLQRIV
jgi:hypothetical protein